jgi:hypothetical protein
MENVGELMKNQTLNTENVEILHEGIMVFRSGLKDPASIILAIEQCQH